MTELPPDDPAPPAEEPPREHRHPHEESSALPAWVPAAIGVVLVAIASLAVYTGIRYRSGSLASTGLIRPRRAPKPMNGNGPPGEPEPGASLIFPGESGDNTPTASAPVTGHARAEISGGGTAGVTATVRLWARRGMMTHVDPPDAVVYVNNIAIGQANQLNSANEIYDFPAAGSYTVRLSAPGYRDEQFIITAADSAADEIAKIDVKLKKE